VVPSLFAIDGTNLTLEDLTLQNAWQLNDGVLTGVGGVSCIIMMTAHERMNERMAGGAVQATRSKVVLRRSWIVNCAALHGGGILLDESSSLVASGSTFYGNTAISGGGGVAARYESTFDADGSDFYYNHAWEVGGAVWASSASTFRARSSLFQNNQADYLGAVVALQGASACLVNDSVAKWNLAFYMGGVVDASVEIMDHLAKE